MVAPASQLAADTSVLVREVLVEPSERHDRISPATLTPSHLSSDHVQFTHTAVQHNIDKMQTVLSLFVENARTVILVRPRSLHPGQHRKGLAQSAAHSVGLDQDNRKK